MLKEIVIVIQSYIRAHQFIREHKLWKWIIIPGSIYAVLFFISIYFFGQSANNAIEWLMNLFHLNTWLEKMQSGLLSFLFTLSGLILWLILMLFYFSLFKYVWLILCSPVFAYLSEKTEAILEGKDFPFSFPQLMKDILRGIRIALRNMVWQTIYTFSIVLLSFIPVIGWATPVLAMFVECYYYGFSMLDYSCERRKMNASESIYFINRHRGLAIGNGAIFYLFHVVPVLGWIFAPAYAVIAATLSMRETTDNKPNVEKIF